MGLRICMDVGTVEVGGLSGGGFGGGMKLAVL